jgi:acyl-CoA synthetase (AMP-forming)/AMP-acid ligase II
VAHGSHNVIPDSGHFEAGETLALIERYPNVSFFAAPTLVVRMLNDGSIGQARLGNLKTIVYGGAPMYVSDLERALEVFGPRLFQLFGQGESPMTITGLDQRAHAAALAAGDRARLQSAGWARTGVEVRVVDDDDRDLPLGEVGEIITRSDCVMLGYWENPPANERALRGGWLHTGDLGALDESGLLTLKDRSKDMIISGGTNIYPREIEDVLLGHAAVREAAVVGAPHPDWGEEVVAFVVVHPGAAVDAAALDARCLEHIARFKRPKRYLFVETLPKNNYGKVLKTALRERLADRKPS